MRSTIEHTTIDLDDDAVDQVAAATAAASVPADGQLGAIPVTVQLPVYVDVDGVRTEVGTVRTEVTINVGTERPGYVEAHADTIPPGPARPPAPDAVDVLDAERARRAQARAAGDVGQQARPVESTLRDITPYECAQEAAAVLRAAGRLLPKEGAQAAIVANGWLSLGLAMATHAPLNQPDKREGDR